MLWFYSILILMMKNRFSIIVDMCNEVSLTEFSSMKYSLVHM
jgi:hypothetical protein